MTIFVISATAIGFWRLLSIYEKNQVRNSPGSEVDFDKLNQRAKSACCASANLTSD